MMLVPALIDLRYRALWVTRKRNAMEVIDMIADGMEKKPKHVMVRRIASCSMFHSSAQF